MQNTPEQPPPAEACSEYCEGNERFRHETGQLTPGAQFLLALAVGLFLSLVW